jgi:PAS domain S-box-containing protein
MGDRQRSEGSARAAPRRSAGAGSTPVRVLIAEDEPAVRTALRDLVDGEPGLEVVGLAGDAQEAIAVADACAPDVALVDVRMPGGGGPAAVRGMTARLPALRVVAVSAYEDAPTVIEMLRSGALGYVVKGSAPHEIVEAVQRAARGQSSLGHAVVADVIGELVDEVADRVEREKVLERSEGKFRDLLDSSPDAIVMTDAGGAIVLVNRQTERMFGYSANELVGRPLEQLMPERFRAAHDGQRAGYFADPRPRAMGIGLELVGLRRDGSEFPVDIALSSFESDDGRVATAFIRDLGDDGDGAALLRRTRERFAALLDTAPDAVVIIGADGRIAYVNRQTEELFRYERAELLGEPLEKLLPKRFRERHVEHRAAYFADPRTRPMGFGLELAGLRRDRTEFPIDISLSALETEDGVVATAFIRDMTRRQAQTELERHLAERRAVLAHLVNAGEEERRRIASDIHDDSIQAITAAGMRLQILRRRIGDPEQLALLDDLERTIQLSIERLRHLLFELRPPALDRDGLSSALRLYLDQIRQQVQLRYAIDDRLVSQPLPETRLILYRIAQEALTNVRKHARAESVRILLDRRPEGYLVRIADDGIGFAGGEEATGPGHIGLVAMRERAELAGGWLRIDSRVGVGTTVEFQIPATAENGRPGEAGG